MRDDEDALVSGAALDEEGLPELEEQPPGKILSGDTHEGLVPPRDYPQAVDDHGTTPGEEARGETLAQRVAREEPEPGAGVPGSDGGDGWDAPIDEPAGRLVQPDLGMADLDETPEELGVATGDAVGLSAEEAAVRIVEEPAGLGGGLPGYLDEEED